MAKIIERTRYEELDAKTRFTCNEAMEFLLRVALRNMGYEKEDTDGNVIIDEEIR